MTVGSTLPSLTRIFSHILQNIFEGYFVSLQEQQQQ